MKISVSSLTKKYGSQRAVDNISFEVQTGEVLGFLGPNGAGKTTFFNLMLDLISPTTGTIINNDIQVNTSENWKPFTAAFIDEKALVEVSGNVTKSGLKSLADAGVDIISVGALTHSAGCVDISMRIQTAD